MLEKPKLLQAAAQSASAWSDTVLIAAVSGKAHYILDVFVMTVDTGTVTFESGTSTKVWEVYPGANGGVVHTAHPNGYLFKSAVGESITLTAAMTSGKFVSVNYATLAEYGPVIAG